MGKRIKIIMSQDVMNVGEEGEICEVASGYARNFLIPKQYARPLSKHNLTILNQQKNAIEKRRAEKRIQAEGLKERLEQEVLLFTMQSGESGKLFGSITNGHIAEELQKRGYAIEKKKIDVPEHHLKQVGEYTIVIKLYGEQEAKIKVKVEALETEEKARPVKKAKAKENEKAPVDEQAESAVQETAESEVKPEESAAVEKTVTDTTEEHASENTEEHSS